MCCDKSKLIPSTDTFFVLLSFTPRFDLEALLNVPTKFFSKMRCAYSILVFNINVYPCALNKSLISLSVAMKCPCAVLSYLETLI